jgi:hypothetical protein
VKHLKAINQKAGRVEAHVAREAARAAEPELDVVGLQSRPPDQPHIPLGCTLIFSPGWEADSSGGTAGLCQPVERDIFDCHLACFWPAHVPDQLNHAPDWTGK